MNFGTKVAMSAVIGGTAEKLGGGKFANGAVTGAYVMMFNHLMHPPQTKVTLQPLDENQREELQLRIKEATFRHRASWAKYNESMDSAPNWEVSMDISGVEPGAKYTAENLELWLGNEVLIADVDYFPNSNRSLTNRIDVPRGADWSEGGRIFYYNARGVGHILQIRFHNRNDLNQYIRFIDAKDLR
jgi:hypothetical protein